MRQSDPDIRAEIQSQAAEGWSGPRIEERMSADARFADRVPSARTIQRVLRESAPREPVTPWTLADADPATVPLIFDVLAELVSRSEGRRRAISVDEARWVVKVRAARPDLDPWTAYVHARAYAGRAERGKDTADLDLYLALTRPDQPHLWHLVTPAGGSLG